METKTSGLDLDSVYGSVQKAVDKAEEAVKSSVEAISGDGAEDPAKLAKLQHDLGKWNVAQSSQSAVLQMMRQVMANIVQRMA